MSYFIRKTDVSLGNVALYEYQGTHPIQTIPHGNTKEGTACFVRTNPKTLDKIRESVKTEKPREIFSKLKQNDSLSCARDFDVIRHQKYKEQKKQKDQVRSKRANIADEILDVIAMVDDHPFVQSVFLNKNKVPNIICYTTDQIKNLQSFLSYLSGQPIGIDRTFNLGSIYVTTIVYKNHKVVRKNTATSPIFLGPIMLHKDATYETYKTFLEHVETELDNDIGSVELRLLRPN